MKKRIVCLAVPLLAAMNVLSAAAVKPSVSSLLREGNELRERGDTRTAAAKFEQGLELAKKSPDKSDEYVVYGRLGSAYAALGDYHKAIYCLTEALAGAERRRDGRSVSAVLLALGAAHAACGEDRRAVSCYKDGLRIARQYRCRKDTGKICEGLGDIYSRIGAPRRAAGYYADALHILRDTVSKRESFAMTLNLVSACVDLGDHAKALAVDADILRKANALGDQRALAAALSVTGRAEAGLGRLGDAQRHFDAAAKIYGDLAELKCLKDNAVCLSAGYRLAGDADRAAACFDDAQRRAEQAGDAQLRFECLMERGNIYEQAHDWQKALHYYGEAAKTRDVAGKGRPPGDADMKIADLCVRLKEISAAEERYRLLGEPVRLGFLELSKKNYKQAYDQFARVLRSPDRLSDGTNFAARTGMGEALYGLKDMEKAEGYFDGAADLIGPPGEGPSGLELPPYPAGFSRAAPLERLVQLRAEKGALPEAFQASERVKSVRFEDAADVQAARAARHFLPADLEREEAVTVSRLRVLKDEIRALVRARMMEDAEAAREEYKNAKERLGKLVDRVRGINPEYASCVYPDPLGPENVRLAGNEVLLEFEVTRDRTYLFIIDGKSREMRLRAVPLDREALGGLVTAYAAALRRGSYDAGRGKQLFQALFDTVLNGFDDARTLVIVPDESLAVLSFESLPAGKDPAKRKSGPSLIPAPRGIRYLGDRFRIAYAQSARSLNDRAARQEAPAGGTRVLLVGDHYQVRSSSGYERTGTTAAVTTPVPPAESAVLLEHLQVLCGTDAVNASFETMSKGISDRYRCLVFGRNIPDPLSVGAVLSSRCGADSAIVPGIDPGWAPGAHVAGRAFQCAGCRSVLLGLWPLPVDVAKRFYGAYVREMRLGVEPAEALARARSGMRDAGYEHPYYWSGFVLEGK